MNAGPKKRICQYPHKCNKCDQKAEKGRKSLPRSAKDGPHGSTTIRDKAEKTGADQGPTRAALIFPDPAKYKFHGYKERRRIFTWI